MARLALVSTLAVVKDIAPGYRIRPPTDKELQVKVRAGTAARTALSARQALQRRRHHTAPSQACDSVLRRLTCRPCGAHLTHHCERR